MIPRNANINIVPKLTHKWVEDMLAAIGAPMVVRVALRKLMILWSTVIELAGKDRVHRIPVHLLRGLFQGDALSPLLFCLCTAPVSAMLRGGEGFRSDFLEEPLTHLSFMDDLKCYEEHKEELTAIAGGHTQVF